MPQLSVGYPGTPCLSDIPKESSQGGSYQANMGARGCQCGKKLTCPREVLPKVLKSSVRAMRGRPILLKHHSVNINAPPPSQGWNKLPAHHLNVTL